MEDIKMEIMMNDEEINIKNIQTLVQQILNNVKDMTKLLFCYLINTYVENQKTEYNTFVAWTNRIPIKKSVTYYNIMNFITKLKQEEKQEINRYDLYEEFAVIDLYNMGIKDKIKKEDLKIKEVIERLNKRKKSNIYFDFGKNELDDECIKIY
jgi:hypothetical protein